MAHGPSQPVGTVGPSEVSLRERNERKMGGSGSRLVAGLGTRARGLVEDSDCTGYYPHRGVYWACS